MAAQAVFYVLNPGSSGSSDSVEQVMDQVEKYIMTRLYKSVFCPETTDDEKKDLTTQDRIRSEKASLHNAWILNLHPCVKRCSWEVTVTNLFGYIM